MMNEKDDVKAIRAAVKAVLPKIVAIRHQIHSHPEMGLKEFETAKLAAAALREFGCDEVTEGVGGTGVVALIRGNRPDNGCTICSEPTWMRFPSSKKRAANGLPKRRASCTPAGTTGTRRGRLRRRMRLRKPVILRARR